MKFFKDFDIFDYGGSFLFNKESDAKYFFEPLKHISFLKNNKYRFIRFLSYISPWLIFPYTLFTYVVWIIVFIVLVIATVVVTIFEAGENKLNKFKEFWNEL